MASTKPSVVVTGVAGSLGTRLLPLLEGFSVIGIDTRPPENTSIPMRFEKMDLAQESSCGAMAQILHETRAVGFVHLASVLDPIRMNVLDQDLMWRINVAGTARVLEAIAETNRMGGKVQKLVHMSSVAVYGPNLSRPVRENDALDAHTLAYAVHKKEADLAVQARARDLGECDVYILRPHIFAGASVENYMLNSLRGTAYGPGRLGKMLERRGSRLPLVFPLGRRYLQHQLQFVHVDDVARVIAWLLSRAKTKDSPTVLNLAGRGDPLTVAQCAQIVGARIKRFPTLAVCRKIIEMMWSMGVTSIPPDAFPYLVGSYTMETSKIRQLLGKEFEKTIRYTNEAALADSVLETPNLQVTRAETAS